MEQDLRYPIGEFHAPEAVGPAQIEAWVQDIERLPGQLRALVEDLDPDRLSTVYRPGGWTVAQVVHHIADSHLNSYTRFKLALTEDKPTIRPYDEAAWGELPEARDVDISDSLDLIDALHARWVKMLRAMQPGDWEREFFHPESGSSISLKINVGIYSWHGRHHLAHISTLAERQFGGE
jgi:hypothetical protein